MRTPATCPELTEQKLAEGLGAHHTLSEMIDQHDEIVGLMLAASRIEQFLDSGGDITLLEDARGHINDHLDHDNPTIAGVARWLNEMTDAGPAIIDLV